MIKEILSHVYKCLYAAPPTFQCASGKTLLLNCGEIANKRGMEGLGAKKCWNIRVSNAALEVDPRVLQLRISAVYLSCRSVVSRRAKSPSQPHINNKAFIDATNSV